MIAFIDDHRSACGVEPICRVRPIALSTYRAHAARRAASGRPGEHSLARPDLSERLFLLAIATSFGRALRRPVETAQSVSIRCTERLADAGIWPSVGSVGDSHDNAFGETLIGLFKTEVIRRHGRWRSLDAVEVAILEWVDLYDTLRLCSRRSATCRPPTSRNDAAPDRRPAPWRRSAQTKLLPSGPVRFTCSPFDAMDARSALGFGTASLPSPTPP